MSEDTPTLLPKAIELAARLHAFQFDKGGEPYILHPLRVMFRCETTEERIVAALHDTVEDCGMTLDELRAMGFPEECVVAIDCLTRRHSEPYLDSFIERIKVNKIARRVKLADIADNTDPTRRPPDDTPFDSMLKKYGRARDKLLAVEEVERLEKQLKKARALL